MNDEHKTKAQLMAELTALREQVAERAAAPAEYDDTSARLVQSALNMLFLHAAVVRADGLIVTVNAAWDDFARANGDPDLLTTSVGVNYFEVCRRAMAVDVSPAMLRLARERAAGASNLEFQEASFLTWSYEPASFDLITTKNALHHLPDFWKGLAFVRMAEALRPGGRLYLQDVAFPCPPQEAPTLVEDWAAFLTANSGYSRQDAATHVREEHSTYGWVLEGLIERSGFRLIGADYANGVYGRYLAERL